MHKQSKNSPIQPLIYSNKQSEKSSIEMISFSFFFLRRGEEGEGLSFDMNTRVITFSKFVFSSKPWTDGSISVLILFYSMPRKANVCSSVLWPCCLKISLSFSRLPFFLSETFLTLFIFRLSGCSLCRCLCERNVNQPEQCFGVELRLVFPCFPVVELQL